MTTKKPIIGQHVFVRGKKCKIFKIHPLGTIDVVSLDGEKAFRLSGLPLDPVIYLEELNACRRMDESQLDNFWK